MFVLPVANFAGTPWGGWSMRSQGPGSSGSLGGSV